MAKKIVAYMSTQDMRKILDILGDDIKQRILREAVKKKIIYLNKSIQGWNWR